MWQSSWVGCGWGPCRARKQAWCSMYGISVERHRKRRQTAAAPDGAKAVVSKVLPPRAGGAGPPCCCPSSLWVAEALLRGLRSQAVSARYSHGAVAPLPCVLCGGREQANNSLCTHSAAAAGLWVHAATKEPTNQLYYDRMWHWFREGLLAERNGCVRCSVQAGTAVQGLGQNCCCCRCHMAHYSAGTCQLRMWTF